MILVVGSSNDAHANHVQDALLKKGADVFRFDASDFPGDTRLTFDLGVITQGGIVTGYDHKQSLRLEDVRSVYCRYATHFGKSEDTETRSALGSFFRNLPSFWVDPVASFDAHFYKAHVLKKMRLAGFTVPNTMITNNPEDVLSFFEKNQRKVIYKPCWYGAYAMPLKNSDFTPERLELLSRAPVMFQEWISGDDILAYVVHDQVFAARVEIPIPEQFRPVDFRAADRVTYEKIALPEDIRVQCVQLARLLNLNFPLIDLKWTKDGKYVFIEANPSPVYLHFERDTGYPITDALCELLMNPPQSFK